MSKSPGQCCDTDRTWFGDTQVAMRGRPSVIKAGRKVFHVRGEEVFWHWFDQRHRLAKGYGP
jgi:hypothetical protein